VWEQCPEVNRKIKQVKTIISENLKSRSKPLEDLLLDLSINGGKMLRPALTIIAAGLGKAWDDKILDAAAGIEVLHMATLVHDDIIDDAGMRRGKPTINQVHGDKMAVFMGDYLLTRAVMLLSKTLPKERIESIAKGIKSVCEAEIEQFYSRFNLEISLTSYLKRISKKTAVLFAFSCSEGAFLSNCKKEHIRGLSKLGYYYGMAFQIQDDILNLTEDAKNTGKPEGNDIKEGVITLPFILALRKSQEFKENVRSIFSSGNMSQEDIRRIIEQIEHLGGINDAYSWIERYLEKLQDLLDLLPDKQAKKIMDETIRHSIKSR
jgi:heptaprenyl diphosphate synthase